MTRYGKTSAKVEALLARLRGPDEPAMRRATVEAALGRHGLESAVRTRDLLVVLPGVYIAAERASEHAVRCAAVATWARGRVLIAGESALHLLEPDYPAPARVRCVGPPQWSAKAPAWVDLTRRELPRVTSSGAGVRCLTAEDAVLDAWARAAPAARTDLLYHALWLRIPGPRRLVGAAARLARLPDRARFTAIMDDFLAGATSPAEVMAKLEVFAEPEFADLEWQVELRIAGTRRVVDALHWTARVVVEIDGAAYHSSRRHVHRDRTRDTEFASEGWHTVRFSFRDLRERPEWCRQMLSRVLASRLRRSADT